MATFGPVKRALGALAVGGFAIGISEFLMLGLLPQVAADLHVSIPHAGDLISAYALGVVIGAPTVTALSVRLPRRRLLIALMGWYAVGNLLTAVAPNFALELVARFLTGVPHGAFFGVGAVVASSMVERSRAATAMAMMFAGLTIANVVGVPLTTLAGQDTSWRLMYGLEAAIAATAAILIAVFVPNTGRPNETSGIRAELQIFTDRRVWLALGVAVFSFSGLFATFSYIAPMMTHNAGFADSSLTWLLALFGIGMTVGNLVGRAPGRPVPHRGDRRITRG